MFIVVSRVMRVCDLLDVFVQRWQSHPDSKSIDATKGGLRGLNDRTPRKNLAETGTQFVGIARTFNAYRNGKWCADELSVEECLMASIDAARRFIYLEDQYLTNLKIAEALQRVLPRIQHLTILIPYSSACPTASLRARRLFTSYGPTKPQRRRLACFMACSIPLVCPFENLDIR